MAEYVYVKVVDLELLKKELNSSSVGKLISTVTFSGSVLRIVTDRNLTDSDAKILYKVVSAHVAPTMGMQVVQQKIIAAREFGAQLQIEYAAKNVIEGRTVNEIKIIMSRVVYIQQALSSGSLYVALDLMKQVKPDALIPQSTIDYFCGKIEKFLGIK